MRGAVSTHWGEPAEAEHGTIPAHRSNSPGALHTRHGSQRFSVISISRARDQNRLIHRAQQRNVVGAIAETRGAPVRPEGTAEPAGQARHGHALVSPACDVEEAAASSRTKALALDLFPQARPGAHGLVQDHERLIVLAPARPSGVVER